MNHTKVLKRAWHVVWNYRALWVFGIVLALLATGGGARGAQQQAHDQEFWPDQELWPDRGVRLHGVPSLPPQAVTALVTLGLVLLGVIMLVIVVSVVARYVSATALIRMVDDYENTGEKRSVREGLRMGWSGAAPRLFLINLLLGLPVALISILLFLLALTPLLLWATGSTTAGWIGTAATGSLYLVLILGTIVVGTAISLLIRLAWRACALDGLGVLDAIRRGYGVMRRNLKDVALMWLIMVVVQIGWVVATIALALALLPLTIGAMLAAAALGGLPGLLAFGLASAFLEGPVVWIVTAVVGVPFLVGAVVLASIVVSLPGLFLSGLLEVFKSSVWTLTYRELPAVAAETKQIVQPETQGLAAAPAA